MPGLATNEPFKYVGLMTRTHTAIAPDAPRRSKGRPRLEDEGVGVEELLRKAESYFRSEPITRFSWASLAASAGVSSSLYIYYFQTKQALLDALVGRLMEQLNARLHAVTEGSGSPSSKLRNRVRELVNFYCAYPYFLDLVERVDLHPTDRSQEILRERNRNDVRQFRELIAEGAGAEAWRPTDVALLFTVIIGACGYFSRRPAALRMAKGESYDPALIDDEFVAFFSDLIIYGLTGSPPGDRA